MKKLSYLFSLEQKPAKGLMTLEYFVLAYMVLTFIYVALTYTHHTHADVLLWSRIRIGFVTLALWLCYRLVPCRFTRLARVVTQFAMLSWWYSDTYSLNRILPNLDHHFAMAEQWLFGCQPALLFYPSMPHPVFSELMDMAYASYFPMMMVLIFYYFFKRYEGFERAATVMLGSFFLYYIIFVALPVTGPQYYYAAVGLENIAKGIFPDVGSYFATHQTHVVSPGWQDGVFYHLVQMAHAAGERPTAAFPSSHVGIGTVTMLLAWHSRSKKLFFSLLPFFVLMCFSTVYIMAHYAIDVFAGLLSGALFYFLLMWMKR